jgi:hypothetical protein
LTTGHTIKTLDRLDYKSLEKILASAIEEHQENEMVQAHAELHNMY